MREKPSYTTAMLFHGPLARERALRKARELGALVHEPFGEEGLKIDDSREIVELMSTVSVGDKVGTLVIGPLDQARQAATDALLKSLEEFNPEIICPVLWANDAGDVSQTIRSRCREVFCPGSIQLEDEDLERARELVEASIRRDRATVIELWKEMGEQKIIPALTKVLSSSLDSKRTLALWEKIRPTLQHREPTKNEILAALL